MIRTTIEIEGMMCGMCESHINDAIRAHFKVKKVASSHSKSHTVIESETPLDEQALRSVIAQTGYTVHAISAESFEKKGLFGRRK